MFYPIMTIILFALALICFFYPNLIRRINAGQAEDQQRKLVNLARIVGWFCCVVFLAMGVFTLNQALG